MNKNIRFNYKLNLKVFFLSIIFLINFLFLISLSYSACAEGDVACNFNSNPTSESFQQLSNPTPDDFNKLPNPSIEDFNKISNPSLENFEQISETATIDEFNKLSNSQKDNFFTKDINNINSKKDFFKSYLQDIGLDVGEIKGDIKSFDGINLEGNNQKIDINAIKNSNYGILVDSSGNLILTKKSGKINFDGDIKKNSRGEITIVVNSGGYFKAENFNFKNSKLNLKIKSPSKIDLGAGFSVITNKGDFDLSFEKIDAYNFINSQDSQKIIFDQKNGILAGSGCCLVLNYLNENAGLESVNIGRNNKKGYGTLSKTEINVAGFTAFKLGTETFQTNEKDFLKDVITNDVEVPNQKGIDKSVTFFSKEDGFTTSIELNIGKKRNSEEFVNDVNLLLNNFIENEIKKDPILKKQITSDWNWILNNAKKLGLEKDPSSKKLLDKLGLKLTSSSDLIPANEFIDGLKSMKKQVGSSDLKISDSDLITFKSKMDNLYSIMGPDKISNFVRTNLPRNKKYAVGYELVSQYGLSNLVSISGNSLINDKNVVFINTYGNGDLNIDFLATKNLAIPIKLGGDDRTINTEYRFVVSVKSGKDKLDAKVIGIEIDNYNLNRIVTNSDFSKVCAYLTSFNFEKCNN